MATFLDLGRHGPAQDVDQVARAEPFFCTESGGEGHADGLGAVKDLSRFVAEVAMAARLWVLSEVREQRLAAAIECFCKA